MGRTVGRSVTSPENIGLLRGATPFIADVDDAMLRGAAAVVFVRSPHAHARILGIDADAASRFPGVLAVVTASGESHTPAGGIRLWPGIRTQRPVASKVMPW